MTYTESKKSFGWKRFLLSVAAIAIPVALQNMLTTTGSMIDTMMIAPLGEESVGAVGLCAQFSSLMFACYWGFVGGGMLFYAQYYGAGDKGGIYRSYGVTLCCMMTVGILFGAAAVFMPETVMTIYTDKEAIREVGVSYLKVVGFAYPLQVFSMAMSALLRSTGRVRIPLYASVCSVGVNIFFNWVFIGGNLGAPAFGVKGAALATVIGAAVNVIICLICALFTRYPYLFGLKRHFDWNAGFIKEYFTKCFPIICNELLIGIGNACISMILGRQSQQAIAAMAVFRTIEGLVIGFFAGFSNASSVLVGSSVGAGLPEQAFERAKRIVYLCSATICVVCVAIFAVRGPLLHTMGLYGVAYDYGVRFLLVYVVAATVRMGNWTHNDTFRSAGDATYGTVLEIVFMYVMVLPAVYLSGMRLSAPLTVVFICCYIDEPIRYILMQVHLYSVKWIRPVTVQGKEALAKFLESRQRV